MSSLGSEVNATHLTFVHVINLDTLHIMCEISSLHRFYSENCALQSTLTYV